MDNKLLNRADFIKGKTIYKFVFDPEKKSVKRYSYECSDKTDKSYWQLLFGTVIMFVDRYGKHYISIDKMDTIFITDELGNTIDILTIANMFDATKHKYILYTTAQDRIYGYKRFAGFFGVISEQVNELVNISRKLVINITDSYKER